MTLRSQITLPSFKAFICEKAKPDVTLETTEEAPSAGGEEIICSRIAVRKAADGCHSDHEHRLSRFPYKDRPGFLRAAGGRHEGTQAGAGVQAGM